MPPLLRLPESIDVERLPQVGRALGLPVLDRDAAAIGDLHHRIERRERGAGIDEARVADSRTHPAARSRDITAADHGLDESDQRVTVRHAAGATVGDGLEAVARSAGSTALTEQGCVARRSIETLIQGRRPPGDQLDLGMRDGSILVGEIADLVVLQVQLNIEIEEVDDGLRH